jgi:hypothetical protein
MVEHSIIRSFALASGSGLNQIGRIGRIFPRDRMFTRKLWHIATPD